MFNIGDLVICDKPYRYGITDIDVVCKITTLTEHQFLVTPVEILGKEECVEHYDIKLDSIDNKEEFLVEKNILDYIRKIRKAM